MSIVSNINEKSINTSACEFQKNIKKDSIRKIKHIDQQCLKS